MPQLVGFRCVRCQQRIGSILEGRFCPECDAPVHNPCVHPEADGASNRCPTCGGDRNAQQLQRQAARLKQTPPEPDNQRPRSVTIIGSLLMILAIGALIASTATWNDPTVQRAMALNPVPVSIQYAMSYVSLALMLISGFAILAGYNWGRWLYVISTLAGMLFSLLTSPGNMKLLLIPGFLIFLLLVSFLFHPQASAYFLRDEPAEPKET